MPSNTDHNSTELTFRRQRDDVLLDLIKELIPATRRLVVCRATGSDQLDEAIVLVQEIAVALYRVAQGVMESPEGAPS